MTEHDAEDELRPEQRTVKCDRCEDREITTRRQRGQHLCGPCKEDLAELSDEWDDPMDERELTPMDKRWR